MSKTVPHREFEKNGRDI